MGPILGGKRSNLILKVWWSSRSRRGPLTTISGFIPSYTHVQPWLNRVCWGYNYLITRVPGPFLMVGSVVDLIDFSHPDAFGPSGWDFDAKTAFLTNEAGPPKRQPKNKVLKKCQVSFSDHPKPLQGWGKFHVNPLAYEICAVYNWKRVPCLEWIWSFFASCFTSQTLKKSVEGLCMKAYLSTCEVNPGNLFSADTALRRGVAPCFMCFNSGRVTEDKWIGVGGHCVAWLWRCFFRCPLVN